MRKLICTMLAAAMLLLAACAGNASAIPPSGADNSATSGKISSAAPVTPESPGATAYPYTFTDSTGVTITLESQPKRVAILFSSYADIWQSAGGRISITVQESIQRGFAPDTCILVDEKSGHTTIDTELLIASEPDLVIGTADYDVQCETARLCLDNNIPAALFKVETFADYLSVLKICTDITGNPDSYLTYGVQIEEKIDNLLSKISAQNSSAPNILFVRAGSSARSTKAKTAQDNFVCFMLKELNTYNIAENAPVLLDGLSLEEILVADPEHIFVTTMGDEAAARDYMNSVLEQAGWWDLRAVKSGAVSYLPKDLFHYKPNSRWYEAYRYLTDILYPETKID